MQLWHETVELRKRPLIIAEAGINHNGNLDTAFKMIETAKSIGFEAIKFQLFKAEEFNIDTEQLYTYKSQGKLITEPMIDMFKRCEFEKEQWYMIKKKCVELGIEFMCTPQNYSDLQLLMDIGISMIKIGSDDFINIPLIEQYKSTGLPIILSCGMADLGEIYKSLCAAGFYEDYPLALLLCTSQYPTLPNDVNLLKLTSLRKTFNNLNLGFSDHTQGNIACIGAAALGAIIFEKHFTLDNNLPGPDHWFSENPVSLKKWYESIKTVWEMLGTARLIPTETEKEMRLIARRSIRATADIEAGMFFSADNIGLFRPGNGLPPEMLKNIIGKKSVKKIKKGDILRWGDWYE